MSQVGGDEVTACVLLLDNSESRRSLIDIARLSIGLPGSRLPL